MFLVAYGHPYSALRIVGEGFLHWCDVRDERDGVPARWPEDLQRLMGDSMFFRSTGIRGGRDKQGLWLQANQKEAPQATKHEVIIASPRQVLGSLGSLAVARCSP